MSWLRHTTALAVAGALVVGCGSTEPATTRSTAPPPTEGSAELDYPEVISAEATQSDDGTWRFDVTLSSPYDTPQQYADAWRVVGPDGTEFGIRVLLHDHASEQPFTRSQSGIEIPDDVDTVFVEARDLVNGWGDSRLEVRLSG